MNPQSEQVCGKDLLAAGDRPPGVATTNAVYNFEADLGNLRSLRQCADSFFGPRTDGIANGGAVA